MKAPSNRLIIEPAIDADKIGSIVMPLIATNPEPQQGTVIAGNGIFHPGEYVVFRPFHRHSFEVNKKEYIVVHIADVVGWLDEDGNLLPLPGYYLIDPDWTDKPDMMPEELFSYYPRTRGTIVGVGTGCALEAGTVVLYPHNAGYEVGVKSKVWYIIHESDLLATLEG